MGVEQVLRFPQGVSGKKGVCGRKVESPYGKAVMISVPVDLVPFIRIVVLAISSMQSIGVSILPGIMTIVAQQIGTHSLKPGHKMRDIEPLINEMVDTYKAWEGTCVGLSDLESMRSLLVFVVDAARNQEPLTEDEKNAVTISAKNVKKGKGKAPKNTSSLKTPRRISLSTGKGFGNRQKGS